MILKVKVNYLEIKTIANQRGIISLQGDIFLDPFYDAVGKVGHLFWGKDSLGTVLLDESGEYLIPPENGISEVVNYCTELYMIKKDGKALFFKNPSGVSRVATRSYLVKMKRIKFGKFLNMSQAFRTPKTLNG